MAKREDNPFAVNHMLEALMTLHRDLDTILSNNWNDTPVEEIKQRISAVKAKSLELAI